MGSPPARRPGVNQSESGTRTPVPAGRGSIPPGRSRSPVPGATPATPVPASTNPPADTNSTTVVDTSQMLIPDFASAAKKELFTVEIHRQTMLADCFSKFTSTSIHELAKRIKVTFIDEAGIDSGGLTKEMFLLLSKELIVYAGAKHRKWMRTLASGQVHFTDPHNIASSKDDEKKNSKDDDNDEDDDLAKAIAQSMDLPTAEAKDEDKTTMNPIASTTGLKDMLATTNSSSIAASSALFEEMKLTHQQYAKFMGRFIGKALYDRQLIDVPLSTHILEKMLGRTNNSNSNNGNDSDKAPRKNNSTGGDAKDSNSEGTAHRNGNGSPSKADSKASTAANISVVRTDDKAAGDSRDKTSGTASPTTDVSKYEQMLQPLKELDITTYNSLKWMLENDITDIIFETFTVNVNGKDVPLCRDGDKKDVTEENKEEYVKLIIEWKTVYSISELLDPFLQGFHELVPLNILQDCNLTAQELDLILNGKQEIDVDEIRGYCIFQGAKKNGNSKDDVPFGEDCDIIEWLWRILRSFDQPTRRLYLKFVTGTSRVPLDGYDPPFNITEGVDMDLDSLPKAHTCFNQLVLPYYSNYDKMKERLMFAIMNTEGFELT